MTYVSVEVRRIVARRAGNVCEYCLIAEEHSFYRHQIEHIVSLKHGGMSETDNLALSCVFCNSNKGSDIASLVQDSREITRLYNPRTDRWNEHFQLDSATIIPLTDIGEATARLLKLNADERVLERQVLITQNKYPSDAALQLVREH